MRNKYFFIALFFLLLAGSVVGSEKKVKDVDRQIGSKSTELKKIESDIKQRRLARDEERKKEEIYKKELKRIDSALTSLVKKQKELKKQQKTAQAALSSAQKMLGTARADVSVRHAEFIQDINYLWLEKYSFFITELKTNDFRNADLIKKRFTDFDKACAREKQCELYVGKRQSAKKRLEALELQLSDNLSKQQDLKDDRKKLLSDATAKRISIEEEIKDLSETASALQALLTRLENEKKKIRERTAEREAAMLKESKLKKNLPWPVQGEVIMKFGRNKREGSDATFISNGIRIKTAAHSKVSAVENGECVFAGNFRSYGQMVVLDHGNAIYSVYGFLEDITIKEGSAVKTGQTIGMSGNNENMIYFEIREAGQALDPLLWLRPK